jgi:hypothetical protein
MGVDLGGPAYRPLPMNLRREAIPIGILAPQFAIFILAIACGFTLAVWEVPQLGAGGSGQTRGRIDRKKLQPGICKLIT